VVAPLPLSASKARVRYLPPLHGEHTAEILREKLAMTESRIDELRAAKAVLG
jgi:crotonobetainyl-CoA:carnitine CoA-transferase CaiB-like acyl-CoA transferase